MNTDDPGSGPPPPPAPPDAKAREAITGRQVYERTGQRMNKNEGERWTDWENLPADVQARWDRIAARTRGLELELGLLAPIALAQQKTRAARSSAAAAARQQRSRGHNHVEAFALMLYRDTAGHEEWIWNSRDGVTPFGVESREGLESLHADWHRDRYVPDHVPAVGDRIFVDLTIERARAFRAEFVERWWDYAKYGEAMSSRFASKEEAIEQLAQADLEHGGAPGTRAGVPDLVEVTPEMAAGFASAAQERRAREAREMRALEDMLKPGPGAAPLPEIKRVAPDLDAAMAHLSPEQRREWFRQMGCGDRAEEQKLHPACMAMSPDGRACIVPAGAEHEGLDHRFPGDPPQEGRRMILGGTELVKGRWHPVFVVHDPCLGGDHTACKETHRFEGPACADVQQAIETMLASRAGIRVDGRTAAVTGWTMVPSVKA